MPESTGVYRIIAGRRYEFPSEEAASQWDARREARMVRRAEEEGLFSLSGAGTVVKSIAPGLVRGLGLAATGIGSTADLQAARDIGKYLEDASETTSELFGVEPYQKYTKGAMVGQTIGAMIPASILAAGAAAAAEAAPITGGLTAPVAAALAAGAFGAAQGAGEIGSEIRAARERGAKISAEEERKLALIQGGITGLTEAVGGKVLGKMVKGARGIAAAGRAAGSVPGDAATRELTDLLQTTYPGMARRALGFAAEEGLTEGAQQLSQNILARGDISALGPGYDPTRGIMEGVPESVLVGSAFGGALGGGIDLYKQKILERRLSQIRERQSESADVGRQLEDALISREIEGQRQEEIAQGIIAEEADKATREQALSEYREFAARDLFAKAYNELSTPEVLKVNRKAQELFTKGVSLEDLAPIAPTEEQVALPPEEAAPVEPEAIEAEVVAAPEVEPIVESAQVEEAKPAAPATPPVVEAPSEVQPIAEISDQVVQPSAEPAEPLVEAPVAPEAETVAAVEQVPVEDIAQQDIAKAESGPLFFKTAKGSTYSFADGKTKRNKSLHQFHDPKDIGEKPISGLTLFLAPTDARKIGFWQASNAPGKRIEVKGDEVVASSLHPLTGVRRVDERIGIASRTPAVGLSPLELWDQGSDMAWRRTHPGNPITEITQSEEGVAKLPEGERPPAPIETAAPLPEGEVQIDRSTAAAKPEPKLKLDVEAARAVSQKAYEQLKKLNVSDIYSTVVVDNFLDEKGEVKPDMAQFLNNVIKIASKQNDVATSEENLINTINHEVVHGMRNSGFFTDAEWNLLTTRFNPNDELDRDTIAAYRDRFKGQGPEVVQEKLQEEAVAHAIERLSNLPARDLDIPSVSMLTKVKSLARLGTAANNLGYNAEDLISAVRAGQVGRRAIKGAPTVLEAIKEGRTPRQLMPQGRLQVGDVPEELPGMEVGPVDESEIPAELRGEAPERISKEAPEITEESREVPGTGASSPMYKIRPQKPAELFVERKDDSLVNMVQRGVSGGSPTLQILNDIKNYLFETKVAKAALGPESELGKAVSARQSVLDQFAPIEKSAENLSQFLGPTVDKYTAANSAAIVSIRQSQKVSELLSTMLLEGYAFFDPKTGFILVKKSKDHALMPQLENLAKKGKINQALDAAFARGFMETQRATGNAEAILGGVFSVKDYQAIEAKYAKDTDIQEFLRVYRNLNDALLELNRYVGNFDQATTQRYKRYFYTPRYRVPVDKDGYPLAPTASNAKIANLQGLKPIKGAKLPVADALENIISNAQFMLSYAMKNEAGVRTIRDAVDANIAKATGTAKAVKVREPKFAGDPGRVVRVNVKGKPEYYEVLDPLLYQAMVSSGFTPSAMDMVGRSFGRVFRSGITRSFPFAFGNMFLDSINLWSLGIYKGSPIVAIPRNLIEGGVSVFNSAFWKTDPALQELASAGLLPSDIAARNAIDTAKNIKKKLKIEQDESLKYLFSKVWDGSVGFMEKLASASETVNRVQVYKNVLKDMRNTGMSAEEAKATALYATMQYPVNFDTRGSGQIASWVASYLPFVSASAQGTDVFYRHIRDIVRTGKTRTLPSGRVVGGKQMSSPLQRSMIEASKSALYQSVVFGSVYSLLMAAFGWEEWKKLRLEERYRTLLVPIPVAGGGMMKIPVPPTLGAISLMIPAALAESIKGHENGAEIAKSMAAFFAGMFTFDPTPQFIRPAIEVATNKNFFTWRPIENESLQKLPPQYRYDERTNLLSRYMSKFLNEVAIPISPVQFEHLVRGYLGTLGVFANELISQTVDIKSQDEPERFRPFTDPHLLPGIGKIFLDPDVDRKAIDDYYAIRNAATQAANALKIEAASEEFQSNPEALREMLILSRINEAMEAGPEKEMQELRKLKRQVQSAPSSQISPSRKTDVIKKINSRMSQIAGSVQHLKRYVPFNAF